MFDDSVIAPKFRPSASTEISTGRFRVSATVHGVTVTTNVPDLDLARAILAEALERPFADDSNAHGGIYDRRAFRTVHSWRGGYRAPRVNPIVAMFERAIASGAKVMLASPAAVVEFEGGRVA